VSTRITTTMLQRNLLADLNRNTDALSRTQDKLSSGKEITRPSDDPAGTSQALSLRASLGSTQQYQRNATDAQSWSNATETALSSMTDVVQRARELLIQGASDSTDPTSRASIAQEISQIVDSLKETANTNYAGHQLFSGTATSTKAYGDSDTYAGDNGTIARQIGPGVSVGVNVTADQILGNGQASGDNKLLAVLRDIHDHLTSGDSASLQGTDLSRLDDNLNNLLTIRATNGAVSNRLQSAQDRLTSIEQMATSSLSDVEDADMAKTMTDFSVQSSAYQAALRAGANIVQASLMDFLSN
jgi:flagellar hook-associated protein 3 FlgL